VAAGVEVGTNDVLVMVSVWVQVTVVEVVLVMTVVGVEVGLEEVGGGVVVLLEVGPTHFPLRAVPNPHHSDIEDDELAVDLEVGG
jgi:hypothetical protein